MASFTEFYSTLTSINMPINVHSTQRYTTTFKDDQTLATASGSIT